MFQEKSSVIGHYNYRGTYGIVYILGSFNPCWLLVLKDPRKIVLLILLDRFLVAVRF